MYNDKFKKTFRFTNTDNINKIIEEIIGKIKFLTKNLRVNFRNVEFKQKKASEIILEPECDSALRKNSELALLDLLNKTLRTSIDQFENYHVSNSTLKVQSDVLALEIYLTPIFWDNKRRLLLIFNDLTTNQTNERLVQMDKYKDLLLATVSHDLRNPLSGMLFVIDELFDISNEQQGTMLKLARASGDLLLIMINDILDYCQLQSNQLRVRMGSFKVRDLINEIITLMKWSAQGREVKLQCNIEEDVPETIFSDKDRLKQILYNLISNAIKFTSKGSVTVSAELNHLERTFLKITVQDSGIGIKEEDIPKLFKIYGKLDQHNPEVNKNGIGLGLKICQDLVTILNPQGQSKIEVTSQINVGSKFEFSIPHQYPENINQDFKQKMQLSARKMTTLEKEIIQYTPSPAKNMTSFVYSLLTSPVKEDFIVDNSHLRSLDIRPCNLGQMTPSTRRTKATLTPSIYKFQETPEKTNPKLHARVLLVDDDYLQQLCVGQILKAMDVGYDTASNGQEALNLLDHHEYKMILMDSEMAIMGGIEATLKIKARVSKGLMKDLPIIGLTGNGSAEFEKLAKSSGMATVLSKPFKKQMVIETLKQYLN
jgi:signal transduction histidine kinase/CheY-like chemotaxis protein